MTNEQISQILWLRALGYGQKQLAQMFNTSSTTIRNIVPKKFKWARLNAGQIEQIRKLRVSGLAIKDIAKKFNLTPNAIARYIKDIVPAKIKRRPRGYPAAIRKKIKTLW